MHAHLRNTWTTFDVINVGHLHCKHPRFSDLDELHATITKWLMTSTLSSKIMTKFPTYYKEGEVVLPQVFLDPGKPFFGTATLT